MDLKLLVQAVLTRPLLAVLHHRFSLPVLCPLVVVVVDLIMGQMVGLVVVQEQVAPLEHGIEIRAAAVPRGCRRRAG